MSEASFDIAGRRIGDGAPPYMIAEMSGNHNGELGRALALIDAAKAAGADAVKLQTYTADTLTIDSDRPEFMIHEGLWKGRRLHELYREAHTPWEWHEQLFAHAREIGITIFSTPFDHSAVDLLERLGAPAYKIASFELVDIPLIERVAATGKPMIMSTGMATVEEIGDAVAAARAGGCRDIVLLHCVSSYPAPAADSNLRRIPELARRFGVVAGLSDHTMGISVPVAAVALGAAVIEKHFTLARADGGVDSAFSLEKDELAVLVQAMKDAHLALGDAMFRTASAEEGSLRFRRSLFVVADVAAGETLTAQNVRSIRPGNGLAPKHLKNVLGHPAARDLKRGEPLQLDMIENLKL
jgi:N-acetylneuraminate synthase